MAVAARAGTASREAEAQVANWTADYAPLSGHPRRIHRPRRRAQCELDAAAARIWRAADPAIVAERFAAADRRIRNRGMSYRVRGEATERVWPLSRLPLLIPVKEWRQIESGVIQRAELIERVLADVYGEGS